MSNKRQLRNQVIREGDSVKVEGKRGKMWKAQDAVITEPIYKKEVIDGKVKWTYIGEKELKCVYIKPTKQVVQTPGAPRADWTDEPRIIKRKKKKK